jgi:hypothetical protein
MDWLCGQILLEQIKKDGDFLLLGVLKKLLSNSW